MHFDGKMKNNRKKIERGFRDTSLWKFDHTDDRKVWGISPVS